MWRHENKITICKIQNLANKFIKMVNFNHNKIVNAPFLNIKQMQI